MLSYVDCDKWFRVFLIFLLKICYDKYIVNEMDVRVE